MPAKLSIIASYFLLILAGAACVILPASMLAEADRPGITYEVENDDRQVSAAVYTEDGRLVRTLLHAEKHDAGEYTLEWGGLVRWRAAVQFTGRYPASVFCIRRLSTPCMRWFSFE